MIYQDTKRFLKRHLKKPSVAYKWGAKDNFLFLDYIQSRYSDEEINNNAIETREAFRDFFEPIGSAIVRFSLDTGITYKILPYHVEVSKSKHLTNLIKCIRENRRSVEYPHNGKDDQIALLGKIRRKINAEIMETKEKVNKKELVRYAIKQALGLDDKDIVLSLKKKFVIKLFNKNSFVSSTNKTDNETRKNSTLQINKDELQENYKEIFHEFSIGDFLDEVMISLFEDKLSFKTINNNYYEQNSLNLIKNKITQNLGEYLSKNDEYLSALSGYILKENLINIHERIAIEIFELITDKNENAKNFLNHYTGQVYVENGQRYVIPEITTEDGKRWNINSLMSTSSVWLRSRSLLIKYKAQKKNIDQKISELTPSHQAAKQQLQAKNLELNNILKHHKEFNNQFESDSLRLKNEEQGSMNREKELDLRKNLQNNKKILNESRRTINKLRKEKTEVEATFATYETTILDLNAKKKTLSHQINTLEQDLDLKSNAFNSILSSVVKALIKRKRKIS